MLISLLALTSCEDGVQGPTTEDFNREREALMTKVKARKAVSAKTKSVAPEAPADPIAPTFAVTQGFVYDPAGMRDPFRSFEWEEKGRLALQLTDQSPLERYDVNQLSLLAIVWNTGSARALVKDPGGKSYIVATGTRLGKNDGHVIDIDDNLLVVKETYVDFLGQETTKDIEMRIRRSEGG
jgi:type IV pilus assembly protein PilP